MMHSGVRRHRRTVSSINVGENPDSTHKATLSTLDQSQCSLNLNPNPSHHPSTTKLRPRAISDLIEACTNIPKGKSITVEELNISINYKDPAFEFGRTRQRLVGDMQDKRHLFKKDNTKQLDSIDESSYPKTTRLFIKKKPSLSEQEKAKLIVKVKKPQQISISLAKSPLDKSSVELGMQYLRRQEELQKEKEREKGRERPQVKKERSEARKCPERKEVKRNFKF